MSMAVPILVVLAWGALAFGSVYDWAYGVLLAGCVGTAVWGLLRDVPRVRKRLHLPVLIGLLVVAGTIGLQLVPLDRPTLVDLSPATDRFLREYDLGYAIRAVAETRATAMIEGDRDRGEVAPADRLAALEPLRHAISIQPSKTLLSLVFLGGFGAFLIGLARGLDGRELRVLAAGLAGLGVLLAVIAIVQRAMWNGQVYGVWTPENAGVTAFGPFINPNHFAGWMLMATPVVLGYFSALMTRGLSTAGHGWYARLMWFSSADARQTVLTGLAALTMAFSLALTLSRSGIACLFAALVLGAFFLLREGALTRKQRWVSLYVLLLFGLAAVWAGLDDIVSRFQFVGQGMETRLGAWRDAWRIHELFPVFGTGFNTYGTATTLLQQYQVGTAHYVEAHNDYLQILVEGGYLVAVPAAGLIGILVWQIVARFREGRDDRTGRWLRIGAVTGLVAIGLQEWVEFSLQMPGNAALFCVLCAMAIRRATPKAPHEAHA